MTGRVLGGPSARAVERAGEVALRPRRTLSATAKSRTSAARVAIFGHVADAALLARAHTGVAVIALAVDEDAPRVASAAGRRSPAPARSGRCPRRRRRRGSRRRAPTRLTPSSAREPSSRAPSGARRAAARRIGSPALGAPACRRRLDAARARPSRAPARPALELRGIERRPTTSPRRMTVTRVGERQHLVELVGDEDDRLAAGDEAAQHRRTARRTSGGVSTAVGSSRMSTSAPRHSTLTISTRCASPTDSDDDQPARIDAQPEALATARRSRARRAPRRRTARAAARGRA